MPGLGIGLGLTVGTGRPLVPLFDRVRSELFGAGEQGIYMPSVHESFLRGDLYQDATGITPVTAVGQPVGLWLDRSQGLVLGPEQLESPVISHSSWDDPPATPASVASGDSLTFGGQYGGRVSAATVEVGKAYRFTFEAKRISGNSNLHLYSDPNQVVAESALSYPITLGADWQTISAIFVAKEAVVHFGVQDRNASGYGTIEIRNISVRELPGNHASQPTAADRPTLQQDANGIYVLRFDGVDDWMVTAPIPGGVGASLLVGMRDDGTVDAWANVVSWGLGTDTAPFVGIGRMDATEYATTRVDSEDYPGPGYNITSQLAGGFDGSSHVISASYGEARRVCIDREIAADTVMPEPLDMTGFAGSIIIGGVSNGYFGNASMGIYGLIVCGAEKSPAQIEQAENLINKYARAF